ncbi:MAG: FHA domain-containing protein [Polyangiaceae bacterium]|nr:FHA domain-containing protein [Polyangiaceae bacterium]
MLSLVVSLGERGEKTFPLPLGKVTIGRTKDNEIFCVHKSLSRKHAEIECDGVGVRITDLASKNGVFVDGRRVKECDLGVGDTFRCGDVHFLVGDLADDDASQTTSKPPPPSARTLPSPLADDARVRRRAAPVTNADDGRTTDKLFALIRATELVASGQRIDKVLDELVVLAAQVLTIDRIAVLTRAGNARELERRVVKTFDSESQSGYSQRVVDWVLTHGNSASFPDIKSDRTLGGNRALDDGIRAAAGIPIDAGSGVIGVLYVDSMTAPDIFRPDDVALLRALANLVAIALARPLSS